MVGLLAASDGNQPTKYSMSSDNDAIANSKRKKKRRNPMGRAYSDYLFFSLFSSHLSIYLYDEKRCLYEDLLVI